MPWSTLVSLLVQFGPSAFDLARKLIDKWNSADPVTAADLDELQKLGRRTPRDAVIEALVRAGVSLDSEQAKAILALTP